ncbi:heat-inducible transcriptional repressor HrcA [Arcanobacterium ihumii]|uniref:heat-inducible transcriptional repressor HrcA n=1 Tax=Arcanobacterium ihumii TaxID=2138162 RepID=UPI000F539FD4|nr:heat-inducible transcriptional repressor HrcA [Arcanobacterium ihumii]
MASPEERRRIVLNAIVEDYVATREPVGSKAVVERHGLTVSPATIRNDMAQLEEAGLIVQPYTSAGRIPTDAGYRVFVDSLADIKPLSLGERRAIERMLQGAVDLDDVLDRAVRLLAQITQQVAVVQYPSLRRTALRHVELIALSKRMILIVMITDAGRVEQRTFETDSSVSDADLEAIRGAVNEHLTGLQLDGLGKVSDRLLDDSPDRLREVTRKITQLVRQTLLNEVEERVVVAGTGNLSRYNVEFHHSIAPILDVLEEQVVLMKLLASQGEGLHVRIGHEIDAKELSETSVISSGYGNSSDQTIANLGIIGPTRMDYRGAISSVHAIANYLSEILRLN